MNKFATLLAITASTALATEGKKCRALVLSGGSNNGAWEAGVIWGLLHYGEPAEFAWDVNSGVSAGALNTGFTAVFETGDEYNMSEKLSDLWADIHENSTIWVPKADTAEGIVKAFLTSNSVADDDPALAYITAAIEPYGEMKRRWVTGALDANTGDYVTMNQDNCSFEDLPTCALASGSIPIVFPPRFWGGHTLADGGTVWDVNIDSAINQCLEIVDDPSDIIVDIAVCYYREPRPQTVSKDAITNWRNSRDIMKVYKDTISLEEEVRERVGVDYRYYFQEHHTGCSGSDLDFRNQTTWCLQEAGRRDAQAMLTIGQDKIGASLEEWWDSQELQEEYPVFRDYLDTFLPTDFFDNLF